MSVLDGSWKEIDRDFYEASRLAAGSAEETVGEAKFCAA
jgi:hypothetical protein